MSSSANETTGLGSSSLRFSITSKLLTASSLSSFSRTLQATLREIGRALPETQPVFLGKEPPRLVFTRIHSNDVFEFELSFATPSDQVLLTDLSSEVFVPFMAILAELLRESSQRTLFGDRVRRPLRSVQNFPQSLVTRVGQVEDELSRYPRKTIACGEYRIDMDSGMVRIFEPPTKSE